MPTSSMTPRSRSSVAALREKWTYGRSTVGMCRSWEADRLGPRCPRRIGTRSNAGYLVAIGVDPYDPIADRGLVLVSSVLLRPPGVFRRVTGDELLARRVMGTNL